MHSTKRIYKNAYMMISITMWLLFPYHFHILSICIKFGFYAHHTLMSMVTSQAFLHSYHMSAKLIQMGIRFAVNRNTINFIGAIVAVRDAQCFDGGEAKECEKLYVKYAADTHFKFMEDNVKCTKGWRARNQSQSQEIYSERVLVDEKTITNWRKNAPAHWWIDATTVST